MVRMALQLIYTKSRSIHGNLLQRLCGMIRPGYGVVGKTRISHELERQLTELASRGMGKDNMDAQPQFLYLPDSTRNNTLHIFGSVRWVERNGMPDAYYIAHFLVLAEDEVRDIWKSSCKITPASVLLILELSGFWAQSWEGANRWLKEEKLPNLAEMAVSLQAQCQPTWQHYTGHGNLAALPSEPPYQGSCMLALPSGTPVEDMLRLLHESDCLRSDLGWAIPVFTHNSRGYVELPHVRFLGFIGSHMKRQAGLFGIPVIEVTEHLATTPPSSTAQAEPSSFIAPQRVPTTRTQYSWEDQGDTTQSPPPGKLRRLVWLLIASGALALGVRYAWNHYEEIAGKVSDLFEQAEKIHGNTQPPIITSDEKTQGAEKELTAEQKRLVRQRIVPISVGQRLPDDLRRIFNSATHELTCGKVVIYHLSPRGKAASLSCELDGTAYRAIVTPADGSGHKWELKILERNQTLPGGSLSMTCSEGVLNGLTDEDGQNVALLLPMTKGEETLYEILLLPEIRTELSQAVQKSKTGRGEPRSIAQLTPECLTSEPQKLSMSSSPQAKKWEESLTGEQNYAAPDLLSLPAAAGLNHVVIEGDDAGLFQLPLQGEKRGEVICFSPQLRVKFDAKQQVVASVLFFANTPHGSNVHKKPDPHCIAGIYDAVMRMLNAPPSKRKNAVTRYAKLFADEKLMAYCEKELGYLTIPYRGGVSGKGSHINVDAKVIEQLMAANFYEMQLCICERLTREAQTEFARFVSQQSSAAIAGKYLLLREVRVDSPGELTWVFELRSAK